MKPSILYISYTGLLDPLGQSQVLQYVIGLARDHRMTLLTFEKPEALRESTRVAALADECRLAGIDWHYLKYHNRPNMLATLYDVVMGTGKGIQLVRKADAKMVHCRSYLAGLMGLVIKRVSGVRHIFDMRGFWPDERVDGGIWQSSSIQYRLFKRLERTLFLGTDHIVSLTHAGAYELGRFGYLAGRLPPVSVIPTCTNLEIFYPKILSSNDKNCFTLGYVGSTGSWYLFDQVAKAVKLLFDAYPESRFLVINRGTHDAIRRELLSAGVPMARVEIRAVAFEDVADEIACMDAGIFLIKPLWSKLASCPTRMGEFLGMGKPCLANDRVGDVEAIFSESRTGIVVHDINAQALGHAVHQLVAMSKEPEIAARCRKAAEERFSLQGGINSYAAIYASLMSATVRSAA